MKYQYNTKAIQWKFALQWYQYEWHFSVPTWGAEGFSLSTKKAPFSWKIGRGKFFCNIEVWLSKAEGKGEFVVTSILSYKQYPLKV